jgi:hypothetical protein
MMRRQMMSFIFLKYMEQLFLSIDPGPANCIREHPSGITSTFSGGFLHSVKLLFRSYLHFIASSEYPGDQCRPSLRNRHFDLYTINDWYRRIVSFYSRDPMTKLFYILHVFSFSELPVYPLHHFCSFGSILLPRWPQ